MTMADLFVWSHRPIHIGDQLTEHFGGDEGPVGELVAEADELLATLGRMRLENFALALERTGPLTFGVETYAYCLADGRPGYGPADRSGAADAAFVEVPDGFSHEEL